MAATALRTAVFIDGANFTRSMRKGYERAPNVAYAKLGALVAPSGTALVGTYYYDALPYIGPGATSRDLAHAARKRRFFEGLRHRDVVVREGRVARETTIDGSEVDRQKVVDVLLATDLVWLAAKDEIDVAVLVTGDSDFLPAVELAKKANVHVRLVRTEWARNVHRDLVRAASELFIVDRAMLEMVSLPRRPANDNFDPWESRLPGRE